MQVSRESDVATQVREIISKLMENQHICLIDRCGSMKTRGQGVVDDTIHNLSPRPSFPADHIGNCENVVPAWAKDTVDLLKGQTNIRHVLQCL